MVGRVRERKDVCGLKWTDENAAFQNRETGISMDFIYSKWLNSTVFPYDRQGVLLVNTGNWQHYSKLLQQHWDPDTYYRSMLGVPTFDEKFRTRPLYKRPATISRKL